MSANREHGAEVAQSGDLKTSAEVAQSGDLKTRNELQTSEKMSEENDTPKIRENLSPCQSCGHWVKPMLTDFVNERVKKCKNELCQSCSNYFHIIYDAYGEEKKFSQCTSIACDCCTREFKKLCMVVESTRPAGADLCLPFKEMAEILHIPLTKISESCKKLPPQETIHGNCQGSNQSTSPASPNQQSCQQCGKLRSDLEKMEKEYTSFRERMGEELNQEIQQNNVLSEDITDPCRESNLRTEMEKLSFHFNEAKMAIKKTQINTQALKTKMECIFETARQRMTEKQNHMKEIFSKEQNKTFPKSPDHLQIALQNLQWAMYHKTDSYYESIIQGFIRNDPKEVNELLVKWYRLSCLMVLHNPPLLPEWDETGFPCGIILATDTEANNLKNEENKGTDQPMEST